jgi:predicted metal-dependent hydrolase
MPAPQYPDPFAAFVEHFNAKRYRDCITPLEVLWFAERDDFHKALIRMCVGCNQIGLGLDSGPRFLLTTAQELLAPYGAEHNGVNIDSITAFLQAALSTLDDPLPRTVPSLKIVLRPQTTDDGLPETTVEPDS